MLKSTFYTVSPSSSDPDDRAYASTYYLRFFLYLYPLDSICHVATRVVLLKDFILSNVKCLQWFPITFWSRLDP